VLPIHLREQALAYRCAAEHGISPSRGKDQRTKGDGMNTGISLGRTNCMISAKWQRLEASVHRRRMPSQFSAFYLGFELTLSCIQFLAQLDAICG